ncbi:hypothetical protein DXG01_005933 [Tephrocybe rancida]|nr:hypothetical protein DXG01_005933 [Tephrocybe rancida]
MDIRLYNLPYDANKWTVTRCIATIVHSKEFAPRQRDETAVERPINFSVKLNPSKAGGVGNDGSGILTFPTSEDGFKFLKWVEDSPLKIEGKKIKFRRGGFPRPGEAETLKKTPYADPDIEEEHQRKVWELSDKFRVNAVQFGVFYRPNYPGNDREPLKPRAFSVEWGHRYDIDSEGWLSFEYDHKFIRITLGSEMKDQIGSSIAVSFASIQKIAVGYDGDPYICFDTLTPPILEEIEFHRQLTGDRERDSRKYKHRIGSINPGHKEVAPYAHHLRLLLHNGAFDMAAKFKEMCTIAGLSDSMIIRCEGPNRVEADRMGFFTPKRLYNLRNEFKKLPWTIAFQLESLLRNGLLHTQDLANLLKQVQDLCKASRHAGNVSTLLRQYHEKLEVRSLRQSPLRCFEEVRRNFTAVDSTLPRGNFLCSHVTFTPTRMILEGPYATQSNRVIRMYEDYLDHFVRVDFRDEDRLQYRWDRSVDGSTYLQERVGGVLKGGFELAGRRFEFLAYSSSALREHAVWFMNPFHHPEKGWVDSEYIRQTLGDFKKDKELLHQPSKYAARLAQAFTATDPSVQIHKREWEEVPDLGLKPYLFTDGVGTIAKSLGDEIWTALCSGRGDHGAGSVQPSAVSRYELLALKVSIDLSFQYQIRFLGYKGVVGVDEQLDKHPDGIRMRLRESMRKFSVFDVELAEIEIAQSFEHPNTCYLNRPLIMILEDLGVRMDSFVELQEMAVAEARTINDSSGQFRNVLDAHGLGRPYRLSYLLRRIEDLKLELHPRYQTPGFDNSFFQQLRQVAMMDVLRDIKHSARIPIPESYLLVGVADEGPAYKVAGAENVYTLPEGHIFVCIHDKPEEAPRWLEGSCSISRSPVVHPGDVQRVRAIGKPPDGMLCLFAHMKNVVVLPSVGARSLASQLGGGDVDGDQFSVICYEPLLPADTDDPASYISVGTKEIDRDSTVDDICDFIVEYINSDVLAVDYPKQGIPVDIDNDRLPRTLIRCKPDWHAAEVVSPRQTDYYESSRALGVLYRSITLEDVHIHLSHEDQHLPLADPISLRLKGIVESHLIPNLDSEGLSAMFRGYIDELHYICATHVLSDAPGIRLLEAEVVVGTILAKCSQKRYRKDRIYRMRLHASTLVRDVQRQIIDDLVNASQEQLINGLSTAWAAWNYSQSQKHAFGACSFGLIALGMIFDCMGKLAAIQIFEDPDPKPEIIENGYGWTKFNNRDLTATIHSSRCTMPSRSVVEDSSSEYRGSPPPRNNPIAKKVFEDEHGTPICFHLHKSIKLDWQRQNLTRDIKAHGGRVLRDDSDVDTVLVDEKYCSAKKLQLVYNIHRDTWKRDAFVEPISFVQRCIREGQVRHRLVKVKGMGGALAEHRREYTRNDDEKLARYIALKIPDPKNGGRRGEGVYKELEMAYEADPEQFAWVKRHPWSSWRNRYNKNIDYFTPLINYYVEREEPGPKQAYGLQRKPRLVFEEEDDDDGGEFPVKRRRVESPASSEGSVEIIHSNLPTRKGKAKAIAEEEEADERRHSPVFVEPAESEPGPERSAVKYTYANRSRRAPASSPLNQEPQTSQATLVEGGQPQESLSPEKNPQLPSRQPSEPRDVTHSSGHNLRQTGLHISSSAIDVFLVRDSPAGAAGSGGTTSALAAVPPPQTRPATTKVARRAQKQPLASVMPIVEPPYRNTRSRSRTLEPSVQPMRPAPRRKKARPQLQEESASEIRERDEEEVSSLPLLRESLEEEEDVEELLVNNISGRSQVAEDSLAINASAPPAGQILQDEAADESSSIDSDDAQTDQWLRRWPAQPRPAGFDVDPADVLRSFQEGSTATARSSRASSGVRPFPFARLLNDNPTKTPHSAPGPSRDANNDATPTQQQLRTPGVDYPSRLRRSSTASIELFPIVGTKASAAKKNIQTEEKRTLYKPPVGTRAAKHAQQNNQPF